MKIIAASLIVLLPSTAYAWLEDTSDKAWSSGWGQGTSEARVTSGSGNEIYVACESGSGRYSSISFKLGAKYPKGGEMLMMFDRQQPVVVPVGERGDIVSDSSTGDYVFQYVIEGFRRYNNVYMQFTDGREAVFTLKGAAKAIGHCKSVHEVDEEKIKLGMNQPERPAEQAKESGANKLPGIKSPDRITTVIVKTSDISESGDGFSFKTKEGRDYYIYAAGNNTPGFKLLYESEEKGIEVCIRFNPEHGMGDVRSVSRGSCSGIEKGNQPQNIKGVLTGANPLSSQTNQSNKTNSTIKLKD